MNNNNRDTQRNKNSGSMFEAIVVYLFEWTTPWSTESRKSIQHTRNKKQK